MTIPYLDLKAITALHSEEIQAAVATVVGSGWYLQGEAVRRFEEHYAQYIGTRHCIGMANGLDALTLTLRAYKELGKLHEGDEVLVPANTFIATVLSITENRLTPVFVDVEKDTLDLNIQALEKAITSRTKALMLVHLYGRCAYNETIQSICTQHNLLLMEDNAQAHGCTFISKNSNANSCQAKHAKEMLCQPSVASSQRTGSLGHAACHSFYPGKNLGALGDGGAVTTNDDELACTIRAIANYGFSRKYVAPMQGRNSRLDEVQAAVLDVKLQYLDEENQRRQSLARTYYHIIGTCDAIRLPSMMDNGNNVYHIFPIFSHQRDKLQQRLQEKGIQTLIHYPIPPHKQDCYREWNHLTFPVTEQLAYEELSLPLHPAMSDEEIRYVAKSLLESI